MHEYSIVTSLLELCEENAKKEGSQKITKVEVKIGVLSGVEPYLLQSAFDTFKEKTICDGAEFVMNIQPLTIECRNCQQVSELQKIHYCCQKCESTNVKVVDGEDMFLMSLEMQ